MTREDWIGEAASDLADRVNAMEQDDFNEWSTWFLNAKECLDEKERREFVRQLKEGDEKVMCSSFERLLNKEKAEGKAEGRAEGKAEDIIELLEDIGIPSETLIKYVMGQTDLDILREWHKAAARAKTIEDFEQAAGFVRCE